MLTNKSSLKKYKYLAIDEGIFGTNYKYYKTRKEAEKDKYFFYDHLFKIKVIK